MPTASLGIAEPGLLDPGSLKESWITRRVPPDFPFEWRPVGQPGVGDLLLCEVVETSLHSRLETRTGARSRLYPGDRTICAVGSRYATSLLEGAATIDGDRADLLSASGVCGDVLRRSDKTLRPTTLKVLAQGFSDGRPVNLRAFGLGDLPRYHHEPSWVLVVGSAMDSGKTTACTALTNGLAQARFRVGAAKLTGTASSRDLGAYRDAGAEPAVDFLDCGWPSTAGCSTAELREIADTLLTALAVEHVDAGVIEVADGLLQPETIALLDYLRGRADPAVILTSRESLAAVAGVERLSELGYRVHAVSGVVTSSPLAVREVELASSVRCIRTTDLRRHALALAAPGEAPEALAASPAD